MLLVSDWCDREHVLTAMNLYVVSVGVTADSLNHVLMYIIITARLCGCVLGQQCLITTQIGWGLCDVWNTLIILDVTKFEPYRHCFTQCFTQVFYTNNKKHTVAEHGIKLLPPHKRLWIFATCGATCISSLRWVVSLSNLASLRILWRSFQQCGRILLTDPDQLEKIHGEVYWKLLKKKNKKKNTSQ